MNFSEKITNRSRSLEARLFRRILYLIILLIILIGILAFAPQVLADDLDKIKSSGVMTVGTDATYPPFEYADDQTREIVGFDIDLMKGVCARLGVRAEFIVVPFDAIISGLNSGKYDCLISSMTITPERSRAVFFSEPYYDAGQSIAVPIEDQSIKSFDDLTGKRIGAQLGTTGEMLAKKIKGASVKSFDNIGEAFRDMANGNLDAVINDKPVSQRIIMARGKAKLIGPVLNTERYGIAMKKGEERLKKAIDNALGEFKETGAYTRLNEKWFGSPVTVEKEKSLLATFWGILKYLAPAVPMTILITICSFVLAVFMGISAAVIRMSRSRLAKSMSKIYSDVVRGVPLIVQIFFIYFGLGSLFHLPEFWAGVAAIGICYGAYLAEIFRSGIQAIPRGQTEAALSLGMSRWQVDRFVILPQAIRLVIPPVSNEFIACLKDSSLVSIIGLRELTRAGREYLSWSYIDFATWLMVGALYLVMTLALARLSRKLEGRYRIPGLGTGQ
jgi:arginine/lysine/histidine/glutamine transport system substrate-binding and permease protein